MKQFIYGKNSVLDAIKNNFPIKTLYLQNNIQDKNINFHNIKRLSYYEMNNLVKGNHQGYIAEINEFQYHDFGSILKDKPENVLILDHIQDPQNFGAILRSANVFNIKHIIIPKNRACEVTPTVLKTSSGGFNNIKIIKMASLFEAIKNLKEAGYWVYATALNDQAKKLHEINFAKPTCLIMGNEETGVSNTLIKHADEVIYIEQFGEVQSLNVSCASAIAMYELTKSKKE
ncbi:23S rRNA (guanosine(2251)-2'-O)-methyltransferase RlmB [[Mycoplasma] anseris]|uniref:23S rRNA (Guanosine(2251)-2'-O)-methyltransferase RlmB n=1 Tax=[Mycoplasma] anseris TaxID=92400 RepID=A0A2Z4NCY2_9BACT|nr:23S rRNA (guanosine(2251)-2'-O)-methyltransferase RlmB [[Mycoplasma] anseris]AWX69346.1 23S rRNA (guanosine(2251)-2'-O)-methyltransferase RlmB [[Mycoplasma] anseris]